MIKVNVRFGGRKSKSVWALEEAPELVALRTITRQPVKRLHFQVPERRKILNFKRTFILDDAGVEVFDVESAAARNDFRKELKQEPEIRFAGRALRTVDSRLPVLYTENFFIKFTEKTSPEAVQKLVEKHGLSIARPLPFAPNAYFAKGPEGIGLKIFELQDELFRENAVELCHPELVTKRFTRAAHPNQWHLKPAFINGRKVDQHAAVEEAWSRSIGTGVTIAIIDDGVDLEHIEFSTPGKIVAPRDITRDSADPRPGSDDNHGTACAGVACAVGVGNPGASGVAPGARLMPIRLANNLASMEEAEAFYHAARQGADVISCSWGPRDGKPWDPTDPLHQAVVPLPDSTRLALDYCVTHGRGGLGCVITWAAGNGNESVDNDGYASYKHVIAVAACNDQGRKSDYSDFGKSIWCAFPSSQGGISLTSGIWTTDRRGAAGYNGGRAEQGDKAGNYTNDFGGTSSACPGAAGVAALILSANPKLHWEEVKKIMADTADKIDPTGGAYDPAGRSAFYGFGRLNATRAVTQAIKQGGQPRDLSATLPPSAPGLTTKLANPSGTTEILLKFLETQRTQTQELYDLAKALAGGNNPITPGRSAKGDSPKITWEQIATRTLNLLATVKNWSVSRLSLENNLRKDLGFDSDNIGKLEPRLQRMFPGVPINIDHALLVDPDIVATIRDLVQLVWDSILSDFKQD